MSLKVFCFVLINNNQISPANSHKDLGVIMSNDLSWTKHYHHIINILHVPTGPFTYSEDISLLTPFLPNDNFIFLSLVHSRLLYCSTVWRPNLIKNIYRKAPIFRVLYISRIIGNFNFTKSIFAKIVRRGRGGDRWHSTHARFHN